MNLFRHDLHILTGAYALNAIDGTERNRFERHMNRCQPCAHEVRGLAETATRLAMATAVMPPPGLRDRVLAAALRARQLPPAADPHPRTGRRAVWLPRLTVATAAVGLAAALVLGIIGVNTRHQLDEAQARNRAIAAVLAAPDIRIFTRATSDGGTATVIVSTGQEKMVFTTAGLPPPPAAKVYQLWLIGVPTRSAGLLPAPAGGHTTPVVASGLTPGDKIGVTVEPAGGTSQPTTTPIVIIPLPA
jgi:anti-sigma-K factor RskA